MESFAVRFLLKLDALLCDLQKESHQNLRNRSVSNENPLSLPAFRGAETLTADLISGIRKKSRKSSDPSIFNEFRSDQQPIWEKRFSIEIPLGFRQEDRSFRPAPVDGEEERRFLSSAFYSQRRGEGDVGGVYTENECRTIVRSSTNHSLASGDSALLGKLPCKVNLPCQIQNVAY